MLDRLDDGTLRFLPNRLNAQPIVMGGLTADEMWVTVFVSGAGGLVLGTLLALAFSNWGLLAGGGLVGGVLGLALASRQLRRMKRGRPDTWFYRRLQLQVALRFPGWNRSGLIIRSGAWSCRRTEGP